MNTDRITGFVKRVAIDPETNQKKGYFFIRVPDGIDYFGHVTELLDCIPADIVEGIKVSFRPTKGDRGPRAIDITVEEHFEPKVHKKRRGA